jgi:arsenate reductase (glutaredoxin)
MNGETKMYGISNCDTVKKARAKMERNGVSYVFHDYKKSGITADKLEEWLLQTDLDNLLNKRGTTFRALPDVIRENVNEANAIPLMLQNPSMIKRPVLEIDGQLLIGFKGSDYDALVK